jgi:hypothetical protein
MRVTLVTGVCPNEQPGINTKYLAHIAAGPHSFHLSQMFPPKSTSPNGISGSYGSPWIEKAM